MQRVNNKKAINDLAMSGIRMNVKKYIVLVSAVILTTLLFSSLFTVGGSMLREVQLGTMRQVGTEMHAGLKYLSQSEYEQMKDYKRAKAVTYRITVGIAADERLKKNYTEFCYSEALDAKWSFCYPEEGKMPEAENEIVLSTITLDDLGVEKRIGEEFHITMNIKDEIVDCDFRLSGFYTGDPIATAQIGLVSKAFQEKYAPTAVNPEDVKSGVYAGTYSADIMFPSSFDIESQVQRLITETGLSEDTEYGLNWAYATSTVDPSMLFICGVLLLTFFLAGYLIIYNIFYLNIVSDMQEYGLLKTIGTTGKQIRKMVLKRASIISAVGIPIGLFLGVGLGAALLPVISDQFNTVAVGKGQLHMNIWIIIGAAAFSYLTVLISAGKPCKNASRVSPIEAFRFTEVRGKDGKPKKKVVVVVLSLSLALVILNSVYAIVSGFDMDDYLKNLLMTDFSVQDALLDNPGGGWNSLDGVDADFVEELAGRPGVERSGAIYVETYVSTEFDAENWEKVMSSLSGDEKVYEKLMYFHSHEEEFDPKAYLEHVKESDGLTGNRYGISEFVAQKLDVVETIDGSDHIDWEKFCSGDYVLISRFDWEDYHKNFLEPGDKVRLRTHAPEYAEIRELTAPNGEVYEVLDYDNAPVKEFTVYGVVDIPYALGVRSFIDFQFDCLLPEGKFTELSGEREAMRVLLDVEDGREAEFEEWISNYVNNVDKDLKYSSKETIRAEYKGITDMFAIVGGVIGLILGLIGIINFANTIITSILVRSRELAMLEAVGMTGKQQKQALAKEGFGYFCLTALAAIGMGSLLSLTLLKSLMAEMGMFRWHFSLLPIFLTLPLIAALVVIIPVAAYRSLSKKSVVERLRVE